MEQGEFLDRIRAQVDCSARELFFAVLRGQEDARFIARDVLALACLLRPNDGPGRAAEAFSARVDEISKDLALLDSKDRIISGLKRELFVRICRETSATYSDNGEAQRVAHSKLENIMQSVTAKALGLPNV